MKKIVYMICAVTALLSCNNDGGGGAGAEGGELAFSATVADNGDAVTRGSGTEFFSEGYKIDVTITTNYDPTPRKYDYFYSKDGIFRGNAPFYFSLDDAYITGLTAKWPSQEDRNRGVIQDQRTLENFRKADWLTAEANALNIMPTDAPVPLYFERENSLLEFEIAGQNAEGIDITYLIIELQVNGEPEYFYAYCGNENGHAMLILDGADIDLSSDEDYLIGRMRVAGDYEYTIIFPATDIQLESGKRYLVTLTSQGFDMDPFVYIASFTQDENSGIGIPFAPPEMDPAGNFIITEPSQLVAMSYLIRHYPNPATYDWTTATYVIADSLVLTEEFADLYIKIPKAQYPGVNIQLEDGTPVTSVTYDGDKVLELYE